MPRTIDLINFACGDDVSQWPKLSCTRPGQLALQDTGLCLPASHDMLSQDNGQLRAGDDTHRLVFDRAGGLLELHEAGAIRLLTGSPTPTERLRILATGEVGIGTATPTSLLHVTGDMRTDGALRVAGQAVVGGPLTVSSSVGIGTATPTQTLEVVGTVKATAFQGDGAGLTGVRGTDATKVAKTGDTMSGALALSAAGTALSVTNNATLEVNGSLLVQSGPLIVQQNHTIKIGVPSGPYGNDGIRGEPNLWLDAANTVIIKSGFQTRGMDVAERFKTLEQVHAGHVVIFDEPAEAVRLCDRAYDSRVIGIASADLAFILGLDPEQMPIALCGRVHCQVDADIAPIAVGDLLTTSPTRGHAQKVLQPDKAMGAIIGKALGRLDAGQG
jgi:hypothetical protein